MNIENLKNAGIDYEEGLNRFMGREDLYKKYLERWLKEDAYESMKKAALKGNTKEAFMIAHKLKGTTGNLSMNKFYSSICEITEIYRAGNTEGSAELLEQLDAMNDKLRLAVALETENE